MDTLVTLSVIVPVFNEEEVIDESYRRLTEIAKNIKESYEIIFVNDGSSDSTEFKIKNICDRDYHVKLINFSRNFGHQSAITAGMKCSKGKAIIVIDADLQDPPEVMVEMVKKWKEGYKVVYGKRISREGETLFKKVTAKVFYRFLNYFSDIKIPTDTGDFRLIDRKVCNVMNGLPEHNRYVRGLVTWVGFSQTGVEFVREKRLAGETKYPLKKMIKFSLDAITSFSSKPLKLAFPIGIIISLCSFLYLAYVLIQKITNQTVPGWASIVAIVLFSNGITFILIGIIGEYIARIYDEVKARPMYVIDEIYIASSDKE